MTPSVRLPQSLAAKIENFVRTDRGRVLLLVLAWHLLLTMLGNIIERLPARWSSTEGRASVLPGPWWLNHTIRWDGNWFLAVLHGEYAHQAAATVFYPVFPALTWLVAHVGMGFVAAGLVVNMIASWFAVLAILRIAQCFVIGSRLAWLAAVSMLSWPAAFYLHAMYSEAVFFALGAWAYVFALRRNWAAMGMVLVPLTATRVTAVLFVGLCALEFWRSRSWRWQGLCSLHVLWFPAAFLGFYAYAFYLWLVRRQPLAMFAGYANWPADRLEPNVVDTIWQQLRVVFDSITGVIARPRHLLTEQCFGLLAITVLLGCSGYIVVRLRRNGIPLAVFGVLSFAMFTLNSNVIAAPRYVFVCVVVYVALVLWAAGSARRECIAWVLCGCSAVMEMALFTTFTLGYWVA